MTNPTPLSPAAQVMIAVTHVYQDHGGDPPARAVAATALRAAALVCKRDNAILLSLADELEGAQ